MRLANKTAIITGAGGGIGRACAELFARHGANVVLVARRKERLHEAASALGKGQALAIAQDIAAPRAAEVMVRQSIERFGSVNVLVNSAAVLIAGTAETQSEAEWDQHFNTNVRALWLLSRAVIAPMRKAGGGSIINIASVGGLIGIQDRAAYTATKGAVIAFSKSMALDYALENIRVNALCPGIVETELVADFISKAPDPAAARQQRLSLHPMGRFGTPSDVAHAALYLASDESGWVTGAAIPIDGGYTA
ncbi:MAG: glucose 1-dehydrogenase [Acidobacteriaceae bacterium]